MRFKKGLLSGALVLAAFGGNTFADDYEDLVNLLVAKNLLTPQEAKTLIEKHRQRLAKSEGENLSPSDIKELKKLVGLKISGKAYLHYDYTIHSPKSDEEDYNEFKVTRAYFEVRKYFDKSGKNYFRVTTDIYKPDDESGYVVRLKYAYLNWKLFDNMETEIGLAHRPWIDWEEHHGWLHRDVDKTFIEDSDGAHLINSADLGIAVKGKWNNLGYMFGIYNGEGYHGAENDHHFGKSIEGRVNYSLYGFNLALHAAYIDNDRVDANGNAQADRTIIQPFVSYGNDYFLVAAQFIYDYENYDYNNHADYTNYGYAINGDLKLKKLLGRPATLFARYGSWNFDSDEEKSAAASWDPTTSYKNVDRWQAIVGASYEWNKHIRTSLAYKYVKYDIPAGKTTESGKDYKDTVMAVMQVKW